METTQAGFSHSLQENPMGEARKDALRLDFDRRLKLEFHGTKVTSDAGLRTLREKLIKIGAKVVKHSRYVVFQMVEVAVPRKLFGEILARIRRLRVSPG
jgi:hypothetical protein